MLTKPPVPYHLSRGLLRDYKPSDGTFSSTSAGGVAGAAEVHISYHNGDHYNSVRRCGDAGNTPSKLRLCLAATHNTAVNNCDNYRQEQDDLSEDSGQESEYENSPSTSKLNKLGM